jgi:hypothetical protein
VPSRSHQTRHFNDVAGQKVIALWELYERAGQCALICDAVTIWTCQKLLITVVNPMLDNADPLLLNIVDNFAGRTQDYVLALQNAADEVERHRIQISGVISDQLVSQRNAIHSLSPHCFFRYRATMPVGAVVTLFKVLRETRFVTMQLSQVASSAWMMSVGF